MTTLTNTAIEKLNAILKKHAADREDMAGLLKKSHNSYVALRLEHTKLTAEHKSVVGELERAKAEIKRLDKENADRGSEIMMLTQTISLFDESFAQTDGILLDSIRHMARDLRVEEAAVPQISLSALPTLSLPEVPSLVDDADEDEAVVEEAAVAASPMFVADVAAPGAAGSDFLSDADEAKLEQYLTETVEFEIQA